MSASNLSFDSAVYSLQPSTTPLLPFTNHYLRSQFTKVKVSGCKQRSNSLFYPSNEDKSDSCQSPLKPGRDRPPAVKPQRRIEINTPDLRFLVDTEDTAEDNQSTAKTDRAATPIDHSTTAKSEPPSAGLPLPQCRKTPLPICSFRLLVPVSNPRPIALAPEPQRVGTAGKNSGGRVVRRYHKSLMTRRTIIVQGAKCQSSQRAYILESEVRGVMEHAGEKVQNAEVLRAKLRDYYQSGASRKVQPAGLRRNRAAVSAIGFYACS